METIVNAALPVLAGMVIGYALAWFLASGNIQHGYSGSRLGGWRV